MVIEAIVIHLSNEQPLLADLFDLPVASDAGLLCTNVRMLDGKRPVFIDNAQATFFFPYHIIRFLEIPAGAIDRHHPRGAARGDRAAAPWGASNDPDLVVAEEPIALGDGSPSVPDEGELELDEDFLRRIRDI